MLKLSFICSLSHLTVSKLSQIILVPSETSSSTTSSPVMLLFTCSLSALWSSTSEEDDSSGETSTCSLNGRALFMAANVQTFRQNNPKNENSQLRCRLHETSLMY
ncbi:hypothetical protein HAX54_005031 [Datura stramonium]|uniref:Secreted protein n=1 Tax=Datura stramonium TaxID=4076 RepID=A0ABS8T7Z4_DATST|nr:hypothetical protein [Datura stramonium]